MSLLVECIIGFGAVALLSGAATAGSGRHSNNNAGHRAYLERQARREANHSAYLERQARRDAYAAQKAANHQAYLQRQAHREANRQMFFDRVTGNVERFRDQYAQQLASMANQGLEQFLPNEFANIRNQLSQIDSLLANDEVEAARDVSMQIGNEIHALGSLARNAQREFSQKELQRRQEIVEMQRQATSELAQFIQKSMTQIADPIERDFAYDSPEFKSLQSEYAGKTVNPQQLEAAKNAITQQVQTIRQEATQKATAWKERKVNETRQESQVAFIEQVKQNYEADRDANPEAVQAALNALESLKAKASANTLSVADLQEQLTQETDKVDGEITDETVRREVVKSIRKSLKQTGFIVDSPVLEDGENNGTVVIRARKPSGNEAKFDVKFDGGLTFKFDNYEGQKCRKDINEVTNLLEECYGVTLSDKKVLWENPDRIKKGSKELPTGGETRTMNR
jgi:hypothetical protein